MKIEIIDAPKVAPQVEFIVGDVYALAGAKDTYYVLLSVSGIEEYDYALANLRTGTVKFYRTSTDARIFINHYLVHRTDATLTIRREVSQ